VQAPAAAGKRQAAASPGLPGARRGAVPSRRERRDGPDAVSRVHDMGGQTGFGPVPADDDGRFFHADWEARVYALVRALQRRGLINQEFDEMRDAIERIPPAEYLAMSYYERWLRGVEMLLAEKGLLPDGADG
jgi:nitrile hydratase subunit beta